MDPPWAKRRSTTIANSSLTFPIFGLWIAQERNPLGSAWTAAVFARAHPVVLRAPVPFHASARALLLMRLTGMVGRGRG